MDSGFMMKKILHISKNFKEAEEWDVMQQINMTPQERIDAARELQKRYYKNYHMGLRSWYKNR